jgi:hypothetical protein
VTLNGWRAGLDKVKLTQTMRDGGIPLKRAVAVTESVLAGRRVSVHLDQFDSVEAAASALTAIGVEKVAQTLTPAE